MFRLVLLPVVVFVALAANVARAFKESSLNLLQVKAEVEAQPRRTGVKHKSSLKAPRKKAAVTADWKSGRQKLVFIHIPKNAGTAIEEAGAREHIWWPRKWLSFWHGISMPDKSSCEKYHVPPHFLSSIKEHDAEVFEEDGTFCVTRDPYERAVSEYLYMLEKPWGPSMSAMYGTKLLEKKRCTEEGLNNFLQHAAQKVLSGSKYIHDCHFVPQTEFIRGPDGRQWCHHLLRSENLTSEFNELMSKNGFNVKLKHERTNNSTKVCEGITSNSLWLETRRLLDDVYREDFDQLGYKRKQRPLMFMHIPKTAGHAIEDAAKATDMKFPMYLEDFKHRLPMDDYSWCERYQVPPEYLPAEQKFRYEQSEVFCVTRHPYTRAINEYKYLITTQEGQKMSDYYDAGLTEIGEVCSAEQLNFFLQRTVQLMQNGQKFALDCRMIPQSDFIWGSDGTQWCEHILRGDQLPGAFNHLMSHKGYPKIQLNTAPKGIDEELRCGQLTAEDLTGETKALLNQYYARDFENLDYPVF